jgi:hypothetical protein
VLGSSSLFERGYSKAPNSPILLLRRSASEGGDRVESRKTLTARTPMIKENANQSGSSIDKN